MVRAQNVRGGEPVFDERGGDSCGVGGVGGI